MTTALINLAAGLVVAAIAYLFARNSAAARLAAESAERKAAEDRAEVQAKLAVDLRAELNTAKAGSEQLAQEHARITAQQQSLGEQIGGLTVERDNVRENLRAKEAEVERLRADLETGGTDLEEARRNLRDAERQVAGLQASEQRLRERIQELELQLGQVTEQNQALREQAAALEAERKKADEVAAENQRLHLEKVQAIFQEMLTESKESLVHTAGGTMAELSKPVLDGLALMGERLKDTELRRTAADASLSQEIKGLAAETVRSREQTSSLVQALKRPETRGRWGEMQLRRAVELSGMLEHVDFTEQVHLADEDAAQRPDMIAHLPGDKHVVLDAKVSLDAFVAATECADIAEAAKHWENHARQLRRHVDVLAGKEYYRKVANSPEYVLMFVPAESILVAALEKDPGLIDYAADRQILMVSPVSLIACLRGAAFGWKQERLHENLRQVLDLGTELHKRLSGMGGHLEKLGGAIDRTVRTYNDTVGSMESRLFPMAAKFKELKVVEADLPRPRARDGQTRPLTRPELLESAAAERVMQPHPGTRGMSEIA